MLSRKHTSKLLVVALVVLGVAALSLALVASADAAGPGRGRGNGNGGGFGNGGNGGPGGYGQGVMDGSRSGLANGYGDGTGIPANDGTGFGNLGSGGNGFGGNGFNYQGTTGQFGGGLLLDLPPATPGTLPAEVVAALQAGIADEYFAYATYAAIVDQFGAVRPFTNIMRAEQAHIEALAFLFDRYDLVVPLAGALDSVPQFATLQDACAAAASAEVANFGLYDTWLATVQGYPDLVQVFSALRDASEFQHLPAFEFCAG